MERRNKTPGARPRWVRVLLWAVATLMMLSAAVHQRRSGPTYPFRGDFQLADGTYHYRLIRSEYSTREARVAIPYPGPGTIGRLHYKRYKTEDALTSVPMTVEEGELTALLPAQPPAGKLGYHLTLLTPEGPLRLPAAEDENVIIRFKDEVPAAVLLSHVLLMFFSMLIGIRCALAAVLASGGMRPLGWVTLGGLTLGGMILGPVVQKYAFGAFWTGWPFGYDLTDNKALIMWLAWLVACWAIGFRPRKRELPGRLAVVAAALVMMVVYLIPHSLRGSELDYRQLDAGVPAEEAITTGD